MKIIVDDFSLGFSYNFYQLGAFCFFDSLHAVQFLQQYFLSLRTDAFYTI